MHFQQFNSILLFSPNQASVAFIHFHEFYKLHSFCFWSVRWRKKLGELIPASSVFFCACVVCTIRHTAIAINIQFLLRWWRSLQQYEKFCDKLMRFLFRNSHLLLFTTVRIHKLLCVIVTLSYTVRFFFNSDAFFFILAVVLENLLLCGKNTK